MGKIGSQTQKTIQRLLETNLQKCDISFESWETQAKNSLTWRKSIFEATGRFEESRWEHARLKCDLQKGNITVHVTELTCGQGGKPCLSRAGFLSHLRFHRRRVSSAKHEKASTVHTNRQNSICLMPFVTFVAKFSKV